MHTYRRELLYTSIFATVLGLVSWFGVQLLRSYQLVTSANSQTACQLMAYQSVQSSRVALATLVTGTLLVLALKIVASAMLYRQMRAELLTKRSLRLPTKLQQLCHKHKIDPNNIVLIRDPQYTALTVGARAPYFILSTALVAHLTKSQLEAVLLHEQHHARQFHPLLLLVAQMTSKTLFFIPLLADLARHMGEEFEYHADQAAVRAQRTTRYLRQAMALVLENVTPSMTPAAAFSSINFQQRIIRLDRHSQPRFHAPLASTLTTALVIGAGLLLARPAAAQTPNAPIAGQACNFLNCVSACMQETVELAKIGTIKSSERGIASPATDHSSQF